MLAVKALGLKRRPAYANFEAIWRLYVAHW